ncbi:MAG: glycosyltransferase family 9 protein [Nitrospinae bacterium]|nr:glycosyltransferase family 9 protein [Nitrospinota bacterium]
MLIEWFLTMTRHKKVSRRILIIRIGAIGDVLMATPLISALRRAFPDSRIGFLTSHYAVSLLHHNNEIDALYALKYRKLPYWISMEKRRLAKEMRREKWDAVFLLESNPVFAALVKRFDSVAIYGFNPPPPPFNKGGKGGFEGIAFSPGSHVISNFIKLGSLIGKDLSEFPMSLSWTNDVSDKVRRLLDRLPINTNRVAIHAGFGPAGKRGRTGIKSWPLERFRETIARLHKETSASFVLTGSSNEFKINETILEGLKIPVLNLAGQTTIPELGALIKEMNLVISIDSSPAHIAAAVGTALIVLWGPAIETKMRPWSLDSPVIVINKHLPCSPCYETPRKENCSNNICMQAIQVDEVVEAAVKLLKNS